MIPNTKVFVGSLPPGAKPEELRRLFENYGVVTECDIMNRCGFVHMESADMAEAAIVGLNNSYFKGQTISVEAGRMKERRQGGDATAQTNRGRGGGPGRGGRGGGIEFNGTGGGGRGFGGAGPIRRVDSRGGHQRSGPYGRGSGDGGFDRRGGAGSYSKGYGERYDSMGGGSQSSEHYMSSGRYSSTGGSSGGGSSGYGGMGSQDRRGFFLSDRQMFADGGSMYNDRMNSSSSGSMGMRGAGSRGAPEESYDYRSSGSGQYDNGSQFSSGSGQYRSAISPYGGSSGGSYGGGSSQYPSGGSAYNRRSYSTSSMGPGGGYSHGSSAGGAGFTSEFPPLGSGSERLMQPADAMLPPRFPPLQRRKIPSQPPPPPVVVHKKPFNPSQHSAKYKEWMTPEILQLIKEKEKAYSVWKKSKATPTEVESLRLKYRTISNLYTAKKRTAQRQFEENCSAGESTEKIDESLLNNDIVTNGSEVEVVNEKIEDDDVVVELDINSDVCVNESFEIEPVGMKDFNPESKGITDGTPDLGCTIQSNDSPTSVPSAHEVPTHNGTVSIGNN